MRFRLLRCAKRRGRVKDETTASSGAKSLLDRYGSNDSLEITTELRLQLQTEQDVRNRSDSLAGDSQTVFICEQYSAQATCKSCDCVRMLDQFWKGTETKRAGRLVMLACVYDQRCTMYKGTLRLAEIISQLASTE
jgi:hypothetical protein